MLRLAGLYHTKRGAHSFFYSKGEVERWGGYTVNLIHYEDAAGLALEVRGVRSACIVSRYGGFICARRGREAVHVQKSGAFPRYSMCVSIVCWLIGCFFALRAALLLVCLLKVAVGTRQVCFAA